MTTVTRLTPDEIHQVNLILEVLEPAQLAALAEKIGQVMLHPGFGEVIILIENRHPLRIGVRWLENLPRPTYVPE